MFFTNTKAMKILSAIPRRDGKFAVRVDFTHTIRHYVLTAERLAELRTKATKTKEPHETKMDS